MGNSSISKEFKSGKWKKIETSLNREVLENIETHMKIEKHKARSDFESFDDRYQNTELYNWRKSLDHRVNIVKLYEFEIKEEMFGIQEEEYVYTEKINRFNQKARLYSRPEGFLLLMDFLKGLLILFGVFGYFNIDIFLLGVSEEGKGKVWINENYAKNEVEEKNVIEEPTESTEMVLVNNLIRLVSDKVYNEDFMAEISYPWNLNIQQAIEYITRMRNDNVLFQVEKVYSDRNEFKEHFDLLYQRFMSFNQNFLPVKAPVETTNEPKTTRQENRRVESEIAQHGCKVEIIQDGAKTKKDPSETLSSDSNSRSKTKQHQIYDEEKINNNFNKSPIQIQQEQNRFYYENQQPTINHGRQESILQNYENEVIYPQNIHHKPIEQQFFVQQPISYVHEISRPSLPEGRPQFYQQIPVPQVIQRVVEPQTEPTNQPIRTQYIERKIVKYRPLNQNEIEQQIIHNPQGFNKQSQKINISPPEYYPFNPNRSEPAYFSHENYIPIQKPPNTYSNVQNVEYRGFFNANNRSIEEDMMTQSQKLINNVELCESVIFDQAELLSNLKDLD